MQNYSLCALVHDGRQADPNTLAANARACLADLRVTLVRHGFVRAAAAIDRKSTRLNSSHRT